MKKCYSKPQIMFEDFSVSTNIATDCKTQVLSVPGSCGVEFIPGVMTIFLENVSGCDVQIVDGSPEYDGICYYNPTPSNSVFNS